MSENKPVIFVSHAAVDAEIASAFKADAEKSFLGLCELFVSSNLDSIQGGREWMQVIKEHLSKAVISIGLLSPVAVTRPWIYTEFGAGWIRDIPTISVCHSGLKKDQLPVPLSHFQALDLVDEMHLEHLYNQISKAIGCERPERDFKSDVERYKVITEIHRKERMLQQWVAQISSWNPEFRKVFEGEEVEILVPSEADFAFREFHKEMDIYSILKFEPKGMAMGTRVGMQASVWMAKQGEKFNESRSLLNLPPLSENSPIGT